MNVDIKRRIKKVLADQLSLEIKPEEIEDDTPLIELGVGVDSVATLELIVALEKEFQLSIDESEISLEMLETVNTVSSHITNLSELNEVNR